jgi:hypothetical protein
MRRVNAKVLRLSFRLWHRSLQWFYSQNSWLTPTTKNESPVPELAGSPSKSAPGSGQNRPRTSFQCSCNSKILVRNKSQDTSHADPLGEESHGSRTNATWPRRRLCTNIAGELVIEQDLKVWNHLGAVMNWLLGAWQSVEAPVESSYGSSWGKLLRKLPGAYKRGF